MKLDKKIFKSIVKECLVEILAEGLYPQEGELREKKADLKENIQKRSLRGLGLGRLNEAQQQNVQKRQQSAGSYLDKVSFGGGQQETNPAFNERASNLISKVTKDPIMSEIFADTAASTLQEQREGNGAAQVATRPADQAARIVSESDPAELFGGSAGKWADLAFAPKINR
jgi:hypothetical protein